MPDTPPGLADARRPPPYLRPMYEEGDEDTKPLTINCGHHGQCVAAVLCGHLVSTADAPLGFVENSSDPNDLQAWCCACEEKFVEEGDRTEAFRAFHHMAVVCTRCYEEARERHDTASHHLDAARRDRE